MYGLDNEKLETIAKKIWELYALVSPEDEGDALDIANEAMDTLQSLKAELEYLR